MKTEEKKEVVKSPLLEEMFSVGAHRAYTRARRHASIKNFIFGQRNTFDIIDLSKTESLLVKAEAFAKILGEQKKTLLFVGTKPEARGAVKKAGETLEMPYVTERWIGGLITNFPQIRKRLERFAEIKKLKKEGGLSVYTKKERSLIEKELADLERNFGGVEFITKIPDALFVVDSKKEAIAIAEAKKAGIPVIGISGSDCDVSVVDYPVVANDATVPSISFFVERIQKAYQGGRTTN